MLNRAATGQPEYSLRSSFIYQNVMYIAAGEVVRGRQRTCRGTNSCRRGSSIRFGMISTYRARRLCRQGATRPRRTICMAVTLIGDVRQPDVCSAIGPAGDVWSNVADMSKWMLFLLDSGRVDGKRLLKPDTWAELFTPQVLVPPDEFYPSQELTKAALAHLRARLVPA